MDEKMIGCLIENTVHSEAADKDEIREIFEKAVEKCVKTRRLYHWNYVNALREYTAGEAIAMATSKEEAIQKIIESCTGRDASELKEELEQNEPEISEESKGICISGSA